MIEAERAAVLRHAGLFTAPQDKVLQKLEAYAALIHRWQKAQNLVSRETLPDLWTRHFADSLQLLPLLRDLDRHILDLGSGAGFPALPLAIASGAARSVTLLEPNQRKAAFLRAVARETGAPAVVHAVRAEQFDSRETMDVVTSRALAPLPELLVMAERFMGPQGRALLHKGREHLRELDEAAHIFQFDVVIKPSELGGDSVILDITQLRRGR